MQGQEPLRSLAEKYFTYPAFFFSGFYLFDVLTVDTNIPIERSASIASFFHFRFFSQVLSEGMVLVKLPS